MQIIYIIIFFVRYLHNLAIISWFICTIKLHLFIVIKTVSFCTILDNKTAKYCFCNNLKIFYELITVADASAHYMTPKDAIRITDEVEDLQDLVLVD